MSRSNRSAADSPPTPWEYPDITDEEHISSVRRNAVNKPMRWQFEPPEDQPEESAEEDKLPQLTAEMLETIREEARQEGLAEGREEGVKLGHEEGFRQGYDEGLLAGKEAGENEAKVQAEHLQQELSVRWQQLFEHMRKPALQINEGVERQLITMTATLAQAVCMHEVETNPLVIQQVLQQAVQELSEQAEQIKIALNPADLELIAQRWSDTEREEMGWRLVTDDSLTRGGCVVTTPVTRVDARLEARINDVFRYYIQGLSGSAEESIRSEPHVDAVAEMRQQTQADQPQPEQSQPEQAQPEGDNAEPSAEDSDGSPQ